MVHVEPVTVLSGPIGSPHGVGCRYWECMYSLRLLVSIHKAGTCVVFV